MGLFMPKEPPYTESGSLFCRRMPSFVHSETAQKLIAYLMCQGSSFTHEVRYMSRSFWYLGDYFTVDKMIPLRRHGLCIQIPEHGIFVFMDVSDFKPQIKAIAYLKES